MRLWRVTLIESGKKTIQLVSAPTAEQARDSLTLSGNTVLRVVACAADKRKKRNSFPRILFIQELVALLDAGLVTVEAIEALHDSSQDKEHRNIMAEILKILYQSGRLSQAMGSLPDYFPQLLVSSVASAEQSGLLSDVLKRYQSYEQRIEQLKKKIYATLIYPALVLSVGGIILCFLLWVIIPRFSIVFQGMNELTGMAKLIIWWSKLIEESGTLLFLLLIATVVSSISILRQAHVKRAIMSIFLRIPKIHTQHQLSVLIRFYRTLGLLLQGGIPLVDALLLIKNILPENYQKNLQYSIVEIKEGHALTASLEHNNLTTPVAARLLSVGEKGGELSSMCEHIAIFYDDALDRAIETFGKIFEPVLMLLVGGIIGLVVMMLYLPIFEMAGRIG